VIRSESVELARGLLAAENVICLLGESIFAPDVKTGLLSALPESGFSTVRAAFLTHRRRSRLRPAAENLATIIRGLARGWNSSGDDATASAYEQLVNPK
jgi:DNA-binding transcriptional LysR family regulator